MWPTPTPAGQPLLYRDEEALAMAYAEMVNEELRELEPLVDTLQLEAAQPGLDPESLAALPSKTIVL